MQKKYALLVLSIYGTAQASAEKYSVTTHLVDTKIRKLLDEHSDLLCSLVDTVHQTPYQKHGVWKFDWLPGYYIKYNIKRLFMRERIASCIAKNNLDLLYIPRKYLYHIKGRPEALHSLNYLIVVEDVPSVTHTKPLGIEYAQQFVKLIKETGHCSTYACNYLELKDGRLALIDTDGTFNKKNSIRGIIDLLRRNLSSYYTEEARSYLIECLARSMARLTKEDYLVALKRITSTFAEQDTELASHLFSTLNKRIKIHKNSTHRGSDI
jgi:hypothetical protein